MKVNWRLADPPMECPVCTAKNPDAASQCATCHTPLPFSSSQETLNEGGVPEAWSVAVTPQPAGIAALGDDLEKGTVLAGRYEILHMIGRGGMGAVYKARDTELDRVVALKLIRPEFAKNPEILRRFKQELILARQVTHKNVIRIFDLGQSDGIKFITMDFVEGQDLRQLLLEKSKLAPEQAARIMLQICRALEAAHAEGVIHRDLKPQNIMLDASGRVYVMDFGIARSAYLPGMTQTGALIGTPEYMSPEQGRGEKLTERSDLFSLGIIFYELLTGNSPYYSDTPLATLWKRMQEKAIPPVVVDPTLPRALSDIVAKALEIEPEKRFASAREMAQQLEIWLGPSEGSSTIIVPAPRTAAYWRWASAALAILLVAAVIGFRLKGPSQPKVAHAPVSVLVADFTNHTGDPIFDDTLEPMFNVALEGASFVNAYSRGEARKLAQKLPQPTDKLEEQPARLVAVGQGLAAVVTGSLSRRGDGYKLSVEALDARTGNSIATAEISASNKDELLLAVPKLVAPIRKALGDTTPESVQLTAAGGAFQAASLEAVHQYGIAMEQQFAGKFEDAFQSFSKAAELDPNFARAYFGMAGTSGNLNRQQDIQKYIKLTMEHVDRMTARERYRTRGYYYRKVGDLQKCVEEYSELVRQYPADNIGHQNLANCYSDLHNMTKAVEEAQRSVEISPKSAMQRKTLALMAAYAGNFRTAEREARAALQLNPSYDKAYLTLAYAQILQGQISEAAETYRQLEKVSRLGASFAASGLADLAMYEGRFSEAARILEQGAASDRSATNLLAPEKDTTLAYIQLLRGQKKLALDAAERALASKKTNIRFLVARIFVAAGETTRAQSLAADLASDSQLEPQVDAKLIEGEIALRSANTRQAIKTMTEANQALDTWIGRFDLGRAYLEDSEFTEADAEFDRCIERRGEALELYDGPTYGFLPEVYYYQGRVREGLNSPGAADSYRNYVRIRGKAGQDPLLPEVRHRLSQWGIH